MSRTLEQQLADAARTGDVNAVERALLAGANVHTDDDYAFRRAAHNGHLAVVDLLLKAGADIHSDNAWALRMASSNGHASVVELLLRSGADITALFKANLSEDQITDILKQHAATSHRWVEAVMMLADESRLAVLRHLRPELELKQISEELDLMQAMGLDAAQMGDMWQDRYGGVATKPCMNEISP